jgi:hypothetical protein
MKIRMRFGTHLKHNSPNIYQNEKYFGQMLWGRVKQFLFCTFPPEASWFST